MTQPQGTYTLKQACEILGKRQSFVAQAVEKALLRRVIPPGRSRKGYYIKEDVDKLAAQLRDFEQQYTLVDPNRQ